MLTRRSLLEVDGWFDDGSPATYRFQPALRQEAARRSFINTETPQFQPVSPKSVAQTIKEIDKTKTKQVQLVIEGEISEFNSMRQQEVVGILSVLLKVDPADIRILQVYQGSIITLIEMPNSAVDHLYTLAASQDLRMVNAGIKSLSIDNEVIDIRIEQIRQRLGYVAYGAWFIDLAFDEISSQPSIARLALTSISELIKITDFQPDERAARYCWKLGTILYQLGFTREADETHSKGAAIAQVQGNDVLRERILFQQARLHILRGNLDTALEYLNECARLAKSENNEGEFSAVLSEIAKIHLIQGDLDRALALYEESLQLAEQRDDKNGRAAILQQIGQIYARSGNSDEALSNYEQAIEIQRRTGDLRELSVTLNSIAHLYIGRGDLDHALGLFQEGLQLVKQIGEKKGQAIMLSEMSNVYWEKRDYEQAQYLVEQAIEAKKQFGDLEGIAFDSVKLGQLSGIRGNKETALLYYQEGLAIFEKLGNQRESHHVRELIASLERDANSQANNPLLQDITQARSAADRGDIQSAIQYQEQAVELARGAGQGREALVTLSVMLYNLAGYYSNAERYDDAIKAMEEVVAIDEQTGHQDLVSDRQALEVARRIAFMSPEERASLQEQNNGKGDDESEGFEAHLRTQLAQLPPEQRAEAEAQIRKAFEEFQRLSPEEQAKVLQEAQAANDANNRAQIERAADQARDAALAYVRRQAPRKDILDFIDGLAQKAAKGEEAGSPWLDIAALCNSLVALIKEEPIPTVPAKYVAHFSAVQQEMKP